MKIIILIYRKLFINVLIIHAYERLAVEVLSEGFAHVFTLSFHDSEQSRNQRSRPTGLNCQMPIASVVIYNRFETV